MGLRSVGKGPPMMNSGGTRKEGEMDLQEIIIRIGPIGPEQEQALATTPAGRELLDLYLEVAARTSGCRRTTRRWGMFAWDDGDPGEGVLVIEGPVLGAPEPLNAVKRAAVMAGCWVSEDTPTRVYRRQVRSGDGDAFEYRVDADGRIWLAEEDVRRLLGAGATQGRAAVDLLEDLLEMADGFIPGLQHA